MPPRRDAASDCRLGVLAFGDSITNGGGELQWGVALQSWALWVARALGLPFSSYAVDGAVAADVVSHQIEALRSRAASPGARYDVGCLYIGVNDVRALAWNPESFAADHSRGLAFLRERCDRTLTLTAPLELGLPRAGAKVAVLNEIVRRNADALGALVVDLSAFGARNHLMADRVHPTAFGQLRIAELALEALAADGLPAKVPPTSLIAYRTSAVGRLRGDLTYAYRSAKLNGRAAWWRLHAPHREV